MELILVVVVLVLLFGGGVARSTNSPTRNVGHCLRLSSSLSHAPCDQSPSSSVDFRRVTSEPIYGTGSSGKPGACQRNSLERSHSWPENSRPRAPPGDLRCRSSLRDRSKKF